MLSSVANLVHLCGEVWGQIPLGKFLAAELNIQYPVKSFTPYLGGRRGRVPSDSLRKFLQEVNLYNWFKHFFPLHASAQQCSPQLCKSWCPVYLVYLPTGSQIPYTLVKIHFLPHHTFVVLIVCIAGGDRFGSSWTLAVVSCNACTMSSVSVPRFSVVVCWVRSWPCCHGC